MIILATAEVNTMEMAENAFESHKPLSEVYLRSDLKGVNF